MEILVKLQAAGQDEHVLTLVSLESHLDQQGVVRTERGGGKDNPRGL